MNYGPLSNFNREWDNPKVPVSLRGNEWRMLSSSREIDVVAWLKDMNSDLKQAKDQGMIVDRVEPVIYDDEQERMFGYNDVLAKLDSAFYVTSNKIGLEQSVFLHCVFHYEDLMGENYWVYMRWKASRILVDSLNMAFYKATEDYVRWEADRNELVPSKLPPRLVELSNRVREKQQ